MKEIEWTPEKGSDVGKVFVIKRMDAFTADKWACRVIRALTRAGAKVPDSSLDTGILGLTGAAINIFSQMTDEDCERSFDELTACCKIKRSANSIPSKILEYDIEDAGTITQLRVEAFKLHVDFFKAAAGQISPLAAAIMGGLPELKQAPQTSQE